MLGKPPTKKRQRKKYRRGIASEQGNRCFYCDVHFARSWDRETQLNFCHGFVLDHLMPKSKGGTDKRINRVASCRPCDGRKRDRLPSDIEVAKQCEVLKLDALRFEDLLEGKDVV